MVPAVAVDGLAGGLFVLIVAEHGVQSAGKNLAGNVLRIGRVDLHLHVVGCLAAGAWGEIVPVFVADDGGALRGAVAYSIGKFDALEELLHLLVEGCAADDDFVHVSAEGLEHLLADHLTHLLGDDGHLQQQAHTVVLHLREHLLADDLLDDERYGDDDDGLHLGQGLGDDGGRGHTVEVIDVAAT